MKPAKFPAKEKNKARKAKRKSQDYCVTFKPNSYLQPDSDQKTT